MEQRPSQKIPKGSKLVPFEPIKEPWCEYALADGNTIRIRVNVIAIYDTGRKNPDGKPNYIITNNLSIGTFTEDEGYVRFKR